MKKQVFLFYNTNMSIAYISLKVLELYAKNDKNFIVVFDKSYDILYYDPVLYKKFYTIDHLYIFENVIAPNQVTILDFGTDYETDVSINLEDYICSKILGKTVDLPKKACVPLIEDRIKIDKFITDHNQHKFSNVLFCPYNIDQESTNFINVNNDWYDSKLKSFTPEIVESIKTFLDPMINLIMIYPDHSYSSSELYYLVKNCDFVISNYDILYHFCKDLKKPNFCNLAIHEYNEKTPDNCVIFDPYRNKKTVIPPKLFTESYKSSLNYNNRILSYIDIEELTLNEIKLALDKYSIAYV